MSPNRLNCTSRVRNCRALRSSHTAGGEHTESGCRHHKAPNRHTGSTSAIVNGELRAPGGTKCIHPRRSEVPHRRRLCARVSVTAVALGSRCRCTRHSSKIRSSVAPYCCGAADSVYLVGIRPKCEPRRVRALVDCSSADERICASKPAALAGFACPARWLRTRRPSRRMLCVRAPGACSGPPVRLYDSGSRPRPSTRRFER